MLSVQHVKLYGLHIYQCNEDSESISHTPDHAQKKKGVR